MQQHPPNVEGTETEQESSNLNASCGKCILRSNNIRSREMQLVQ